jgi:hypothetical protein
MSKRIWSTLAASVVAVAALGAGAAGATTLTVERPPPSGAAVIVPNVIVKTADGTFRCWEDHAGQQSVCVPAG